MSEIKRALVLAGGGARGAYQVGMLQELVLNKRLDFQIIRGVSVGALNAAFLSQAPTGTDSISELKKKVNDLDNLWRNEIKDNYSVYADRGGFAGIVAGADSLYSLKPLQTLISKHVNLHNLINSGRDFKVGTVSLVSGRYKEWQPKDNHFIEKLIASASIPVVFPYIDLKDEEEILVDGGVRNISPLSSVFEAKPDEIYVLMTSRIKKDSPQFLNSSVMEHDYEKWDDNWIGTKVTGIVILKRTVDILTDEIYLDDIRGALDWNEVARKILILKKELQSHNISESITASMVGLDKALTSVKKRYVPLYVIAPQEWYGKENSATEFSPDLINKAIEHGRQVAADPQQWIWP